MFQCHLCGKDFQEERSRKIHHWRKHTKEGLAVKIWNEGSSKEQDERIRKCAEKASKSMKGRILNPNWKAHTEETRKQISKKMRGNTNANHRGDRQSFYNGIRMDSSWEVKVADYLDRNGYFWEYGKTVFPLDERRSYRPDFVLSCGKVIEVKGYWRPDNLKKFEEWKVKYPRVSFEVWDKKVLKEKGII